MPKSEWSLWQDELVLAHAIPDRHLSKMIGHGVEAIQIRRCRLKKEIRNGNNAEQNQELQVDTRTDAR